MFNKSSLFLIFLVVLPIALSSDLFAKLEKTEEGKTILNTLLIQTKLHGINTADSIKTVLKNSQRDNDSGLEKFQTQAENEKVACQSDLKELRDSLNENISKKYAVEKTAASTELLRTRKQEYVKELDTEINEFNVYEEEVSASHNEWTTFFNSMINSIKSAQENLGKIRELVNQSNPQLTSFAQTNSQIKEALAAEIKSNLEFRFYDTLGMKPILSNLLEVASKGVSNTQFHKIMKTLDLIENFLVNRRNNLIEDNEYQSQYSQNLVNSVRDSATSTKSEKDIVSSLVSSLESRIALLNTAKTNAETLVVNAQKVFTARKIICDNFDATYYNHLRRYNNVRLTIAELSNSFDDEYRDFSAFIQSKMIEKRN